MNGFPWENGGTPSLARDPQPVPAPYWALPMVSDLTLAAMFPDTRECVVCGASLTGRALRYCGPECQAVAAQQRKAAKLDPDHEAVQVEVVQVEDVQVEDVEQAGVAA